MELAIEREPARVGHFLVELDRRGVARLLRFDRAVEELLGKSPPRQVRLGELPEELRPRVEEMASRVLAGESGVWRLLWNRRHLVLSLYPLPEGGELEPVRVVGVLRDATEEVRRQILLDAGRELRRRPPEEASAWLKSLIARELGGVEIEEIEVLRATQQHELLHGRLVPWEDGWLLPRSGGGALWVRGRPLADDELRFLEELAQVVREADEFWRANSGLRRHEEVYLELLAMTSDLEGERSPERILELALEFLLSLTGMEAAVFTRLEGRRLAPVLAVGRMAGRALENLELGHTPVLKRAVKAAIKRRRVVEELAPVGEMLGGFPIRAVVVAPLWVSKKLYGVIELFCSEARGLSDEERDIFMLAIRSLTRILERVEYTAELERTREAVLKSFGRILERRDLETRGHTERVVQITEYLGRRFAFEGKHLEALRWGAYLHDIGKLAIPDAVLLKPGRLSEEEWETMRSHTVVAVEMLEPLGFLPKITLNVVRYHHERWDGSGYPEGLSGAQIPLEARIFAVADIFDALVSKRPYKSAWPIERAAEEIKKEAGRALDPRVVRVFLEALASRELPILAERVA